MLAPILQLQYITLTDNQQKAFKKNLFDLFKQDQGLDRVQNIFNHQSKASLYRLQQHILVLASDPANREACPKILSAINTALRDQPKDIPVRFDLLIPCGISNDCISVAEHKNFFYFTLSFHPSLASTMHAVFDQYYPLHLRYNPNTIHLNNASIQGKENQLRDALKRNIVKNKKKIIVSLIEIVKRQQRRCDSDNERRINEQFVALYNEAIKKLSEMNRCMTDSHVGADAILSMVASIADFDRQADQLIQQYKTKQTSLASPTSHDLSHNRK